MSGFMTKFSLFVSILTIFLCLISDVSLKESLFRGTMVFIGTYAILVFFFVSLKHILRQTKAGGNE